MYPPRKPWWLQATAVVSVSTSGAMTGLAFVPGTVADLTSPTSVPVHLMALEKITQPAVPAPVPDDTAMRAAIVNVAKYYLRMAQHKTPAEMEAIIWRSDSADGVITATRARRSPA